LSEDSASNNAARGGYYETPGERRPKRDSVCQEHLIIGKYEGEIGTSTEPLITGP
jgi:hypothetical protein